MYIIMYIMQRYFD